MSRQLEREDPYCLTEAEQDVFLRGAPWSRYAVVGDSIAKGTFEQLQGYDPVSCWQRVHNALRRQKPHAELLNLGRMYALSEEILVEQVEDAVAFAPDLISVVAGGNDVLLPAWDPTRTEAALDRIVARLVETGAEVLTYTLLDVAKALNLPPEMGADVDGRLGALADVTRRIAQRYNTLHVETRTHPSCGDANLYASDFQHPSARGQAVVASATIHRLGVRLGNRPGHGAWSLTDSTVRDQRGVG